MSSKKIVTSRSLGEKSNTGPSREPSIRVCLMREFGECEVTWLMRDPPSHQGKLIPTPKSLLMRILDMQHINQQSYYVR